MSVRALGVEAAAAAVPGLPEQALRAAAEPDYAQSAALLIEGAHVVHPVRYLRWVHLYLLILILLGLPDGLLWPDSAVSAPFLH
jgi:hypothetical protein